MNINEKIKRIICSVTEQPGYYDKLTNKSNLIYDIGIDSIQMMQIIVEIENEFDVEFNDDELILDDLAKLENLFRIVNHQVDKANYLEH